MKQMAGKGIKIVEYKNLDELEKELNKLAELIPIASIKIRNDVFNPKKPWIAAILFHNDKRRETVKVKVLTQRSIRELENMANQFADLFTVDDITAPHRLPATTSDSMRHIEAFVLFITYIDAR